MTDSQFLAFFDLERASMREAKALLAAGKEHDAALIAARNASEGLVAGAIHARDVAATKAAIVRHAPDSVEADRRTAELWLRTQIPDAGDMGYVDNCRRGHRARIGRKRGSETLGLALLYATTGERKYGDAAIRAGLQRAAEIQPLPEPGRNANFPIGEFPERANWEIGVPALEAQYAAYPSYAWHPFSTDHLSHDVAHQLQYWMQAWPLLDELLSAEERLTWMKAIVLGARDRLRANRFEIPFNLTFHPLLPVMQVAVAFPALREAAEWIRIVADRIEHDFSNAPFTTPDGYTREGAAYHNVNTRLLTLSHLTLARGLGRANPAIENACRGAYAMQALFTCPDGSIWLLGDSNPVAFHEHWQDAHEALHLGAGLFNRPDWKAAAGSPAGVTPELLNLWLMGPDGIERWASWPSPDIKTRSFSNAHAPASAFHVLRAGEGLNAHAGILSFGMEHNHAHHDKGQVLIYGLGRHLLSDAGHPGYGHGDMDPGFSIKIHGCAAPIRRTPMGPRTDFAEHARTLGVFGNELASLALAEHVYFENHTVQRALALITPWGRNGRDAADAFWLIWDRIVWKRGWPGANEPFELIDTVFPLHAPGCGARISADGQSVWSLYDGPEGAPFVQRGPMRAEYREGNELSDSDANIQISRLNTKGSGAAADIVIRPGQTAAVGGNPSVSRPLAVYRWRGWLPHIAAYALVPYRGVREAEFAAVSGECDSGGIRAHVVLPRGRVNVVVSGLVGGKIKVAVDA